jgi:Mg2+ and Co2+ transporter CorA
VAATPLRIFHVAGEHFHELQALPGAVPAGGFVWVAYARSAFAQSHPEVQAALQRWGVGPLVDLHISDLLNAQLPSHFDDTSWYDLLIFRRLAAQTQAQAENAASTSASVPPSQAAPLPRTTPRVDTRSARVALESVSTSPVGFAVYDRVLITVHPEDCALREFFVHRWTTLAPAGDLRGSARLPASPAEQMLRMVNHMVDGYLDLRRLLSRQLGTLQQQLLDPRHRFADWSAVLDSRTTLHQLEDISEDQRAAIQEWIDAMDEWPPEADAARQRERELLRVRSRDVLEHVERVLTHVRRLEQSAETAVQMHFSALSHRTNDIMRTLTALTAIFLPLNLITGFFGMNFEFMPLVHSHLGFWLAVGAMGLVGIALVFFFRRKRYLGATGRTQ